jgi:hypothetical protein
MRHFILLNFLLAICGESLAQNLIRDEEPAELRWKIYSAGTFVDFEGGDVRTLYLPLDLSGSKGMKLRIEGPSLYYLFINGQLVSKTKSFVELDADSLTKIYSKAMMLSAFSRSSLEKLKCKWVSKEDENFNPRRESSGFSSFIIGATILLLIYFTALLRTNPQLTQDYLNVSRLFNLRDRDDGQSLRIASSVNLLFYFFCSALASLALCITAHSANASVSFLAAFKGISASQAFYQWLVLSVLIFCLMMMKLLLSFLLSNLFGWKDTSGFQFFNFIRMVILSLSMVAIISVSCYSFGISLNYFTLLKLSCLMLAIGAIIIYLKLLARATFHFFHLFFYLCATEVLPLVILTKVLLF